MLLISSSLLSFLLSNSIIIVIIDLPMTFSNVKLISYTMSSHHRI